MFRPWTVQLNRRVGNRRSPIDAPDLRLEILRHLFQAFEGFFSCSVQMVEKICHEIYCARRFIALEFSFFPVVEHRVPCRTRPKAVGRIRIEIPVGGNDKLGIVWR
jgi:hypothetical protein